MTGMHYNHSDDLGTLRLYTLAADAQTNKVSLLAAIAIHYGCPIQKTKTKQAFQYCNLQYWQPVQTSRLVDRENNSNTSTSSYKVYCMLQAS